MKTLTWSKRCIFYMYYYSSASPRWARFGTYPIKFEFCLNKTHLESNFHRRNSRFLQSAKTFLRVSSMKMAFQMRSVEAKRKLCMCSFLKIIVLPQQNANFSKVNQFWKNQQKTHEITLNLNRIIGYLHSLLFFSKSILASIWSPKMTSKSWVIINWNIIWKNKINNFIGNYQWLGALRENKIIKYIFQTLIIIDKEFENRTYKNMHSASTECIWMSILNKEIRRNVLGHSQIFVFL